MDSPSDRVAEISDLETALNKARFRDQLWLPNGALDEAVLTARVSILDRAVRSARAARLRANHPSQRTRAATTLFLYGTLRRGGSRGSVLAGCPRDDAFIDNAHLVDAGSLPYLMLNTTGTVRGELVTVTGAELTRVDMIEGYAPGQEDTSLFIRVPVTARDVNGDLVEAQTYVRGTHAEDPSCLPEVPGGDWVAWKQAGSMPSGTT